MLTLHKVGGGFLNILVILWDNLLFILNLVSPKLKKGDVIPKGLPGHHGVWPEYIAPKDGDSRSACPMLNALANHGILPHDGKNVSFKEVNARVRECFNFAPSFCFFAPKFSADFMEKSYWNDRFDLSELNLHANNAIEHDASLTRQDAALVKDQGTPDQTLVDALLQEASGKADDGSLKLTDADLARALSKRRADAKKTNKAYSETWFHNMFGSANSSTMLTIFGGLVSDLTPMLKEERFADHWEPRIFDRYGLTMAQFNSLVIHVERQVDPKKYG